MIINPYIFGSTAPVLSYKYFRIYITANNGDAYTSIGCAQFYVGATLQTIGTPLQSDFFSGQPASGALVGTGGITNATTAWVSATGVAVPHWISGNTSTPITADKLTMYCQAGGLSARAPKDFLIQGSNDGSTWTTLSTQTGITGWVSGTAKNFTW